MNATGPGSILVVDDEPTIRENLQRILTSSGHRVTTAENGEAAIALAGERNFEVALLDIGMPGLSGMDVLRYLKEHRPDTAVIMITAVVELETAIDAMRTGASDYVSKPFNLDDVLIRVDRAREIRALRIQVREFQEFLEEKVRDQAKKIHDMTVATVRALADAEQRLADSSGAGAAPNLVTFADRVVTELDAQDS